MALTSYCSLLLIRLGSGLEKFSLCSFVLTYSASKNWLSVLNILIVLVIPQDSERVRTCN
jgi:hypothetical protein